MNGNSNSCVFVDIKEGLPSEAVAHLLEKMINSSIYSANYHQACHAAVEMVSKFVWPS